MEIAEKKQDKLIGSVDKILFKNQDNGYHVLKIESEFHGTDGVIATIMHPNIFEGLVMNSRVSGKYIKNSEDNLRLQWHRKFSPQQERDLKLICHQVSFRE